MVITQKGNLQLFYYCRDIIRVLGSNRSEETILNRLQHQAEHMMEEEKAGFRTGRSTISLSGSSARYTCKISRIRGAFEKYLAWHYNSTMR